MKVIIYILLFIILDSKRVLENGDREISLDTLKDGLKNVENCSEYQRDVALDKVDYFHLLNKKYYNVLLKFVTEYLNKNEFSIVYLLKDGNIYIGFINTNLLSMFSDEEKQDDYSILDYLITMTNEEFSKYFDNINQIMLQFNDRLEFDTIYVYQYYSNNTKLTCKINEYFNIENSLNNCEIHNN